MDATTAKDKAARKLAAQVRQAHSSRESMAEHALAQVLATACHRFPSATISAKESMMALLQSNESVAQPLAMTLGYMCKDLKDTTLAADVLRDLASIDVSGAKESKGIKCISTFLVRITAGCALLYPPLMGACRWKSQRPFPMCLRPICLWYYLLLIVRITPSAAQS